MSPQRREIRSQFMEWAKLRSGAQFNLARSDVRSFPLSKLAARMEDLEITGPSGYGYEPLQRRLAAKCGVQEENVVAAIGTSMANHLALAALIEPGDEVLIEEPTYEPLLAVARYLGAQVRRFTRRFEAGFQLDPRDIERVISPRMRVIVLTNLHNPSGVRAPDAALRLVGEIARSMGAHVLVDEDFLEAAFDPAVRSAFHLGPNFVTTCSLTKAYGLSGLRCGWVLAAPQLAQRMWRINDLFGVTPPHAAERLSALALDQLEGIAAEAKTLLTTNRALLNEFLNSRGDLLTIRTEAGPIVFPQLARGHADAFCQLLRDKYDTAVVPGRLFDAPEHFRLGIGGDTPMVREGLHRLGAALDELAARSS